MKKVVVLFMVIGLAFALVIGCGGNSGDNAQNTQEAAKPQYTVNLANGEAVYNKACIACHQTGVAGAAAITDKARWEEIAAKPMSTLLEHAWKGFTGKYGVMPEKGTCMDCSKQDLYDAIHYMMNKAGVTPNES